MRILAQTAVVANTLTAALTVPAGPKITVGYIQVANRAGTDITAEVTIAPLGAADAIAQHVTGPIPVPDGQSPQLPFYVTLNPTDVVRVKASDVATFTIYGD